MKKITYALLLILICTAGFAQSAKEFYNSGNLKFDKGQYKAAIKDYGDVNDLDKTFPDAYYNRAVAKTA